MVSNTYDRGERVGTAVIRFSYGGHGVEVRHGYSDLPEFLDKVATSLRQKLGIKRFDIEFVE